VTDGADIFATTAPTADPAAYAAHLRALADKVEAQLVGPCEPAGFRYGGRVERLKPNAHTALVYLWSRRHRPVQRWIIEDAVWGHNAPANGLRGVLVEINRAFEAIGYPSRFRARNGLVFAT
jgi:hypothetical protein